MRYLHLLLLWIPLTGFAQIPQGYYDAISNQPCEELKSVLHNIIKDHREYPYSAKKTDVWDILKEADKDPNDSTLVIGIYSGFSMDAEKEYNKGQGWSREHVWAKSRGDFGTKKGAGTERPYLAQPFFSPTDYIDALFCKD